MREDFEHWWDQEGQYSEICGKELCLIAWSNGEYKAQNIDNLGLVESIIKQQELQIEALKAQLNPYKVITDTKIEPTAVSYNHPAKEYFEDEPQAEELHEILQSNAELTDEDLDKLIKDAEQDGYMEMYIVGLIDGFNRARAILRKAQEK